MIKDALFHHGGALDIAEARFGSPGPNGWLDLSTGIAPFSYPVGDIDPLAFTRLPTKAAEDAFIRAIQDVYRLEDRVAVLPIPGEQAALQWLPFCDPPDGPIVVPKVGYQGHANAWKNAGREVVTATEPLAMAGQAGVIVVINPNNPDGSRFKPSDLIDAADRQAAHGGWLIVDEAFGDITPDISVLSSAGGPGLIVLRSFGKFFGLPGLRLGWLVGPEDIVHGLSRRFGDWSISGPALDIGARAMTDQAWQSEQRGRLAHWSARLEKLLIASGLIIVGRTDLFVTVEVPAPRTAVDILEHLARQGILTRAFIDQPTWLRFGLFGSDADERRLCDALHSI